MCIYVGFLFNFLSISMTKSPVTYNNFVIFTTSTGKVNIDVLFEKETLRLTQKKMAELFGKGRSTITEHLKNIFNEWELDEKSVCREFRHTAEDGKKYETKHYNLKVIIAVWYRVNSHVATEFRKRATQTLHQYIIKGYALDNERLKAVHHFGEDYFDHLLDEIREIRASERRLYQKITDIYALSADYDPSNTQSNEFFASVQNKLHRAITWKTAAEIIYTQADAQKLCMWLTNRKNSPDGKILKSDVTIAKNYLHQQHLQELERIVWAFLDLAESRAKRWIVTNMEERKWFLDRFLELSEYPILTHKGKVSALEAKLKAETEYEVYRVQQDADYISDFDRYLKSK